MVESDPSRCLTQSVSANASVAGRGCATAHLRAWGPAAILQHLVVVEYTPDRAVEATIFSYDLS